VEDLSTDEHVGVGEQMDVLASMPPVVTKRDGVG
jgi:hypothetical protein